MQGIDSEHKTGI